MSKFSARNDFADHISGLGGWFDRNGNPVKFGQEGVCVYYSDELRDFKEFKRKTGGVIYQFKHIDKVNEWNQDFIAEHCIDFEILKHEQIINDKRTKTGKRSKVYYTYKYHNKEYTQEEINKQGVNITVAIYFDTLLDIIKYYPYTVAASASNEDKMTVYISDESFVDEEYNNLLQSGHETMKSYYDNELAAHYLDVVRNYYLKDIDNRECYLKLDSEPAYEDATYVYYQVDNEIDTLHKAEWYFEDGVSRHHWTNPKIVNDHVIKIAKDDISIYLTDAIKTNVVCVKYIKALDNDKDNLYLDM